MVTEINRGIRVASSRFVRFTLPGCARGGDCAGTGQFWDHFDRSKQALWEAAIEATLNRVTCAKCGRNFPAPEPFLYTDTKRHIWLVVSPAADAGAGVLRLADFPEMLLAIEAGLSAAGLAEIKAIVAAAHAAPFALADVELARIDADNLVFRHKADGRETALAGGYGFKVMQGQYKARLSVETQRARRRKRIEVPAEVALAWLDGLVGQGRDETLVRDAIRRRQFTPQAGFAMARLARGFEIDATLGFDMFEAVTGIALSDNLRAVVGRPTLPVLAALWYAYAQLPAAAQHYRGLGLEAIDNETVDGFPAAFAPGRTDADPDRVLLGLGAIKSWRFAHMLRHELGHALHDSRTAQINAWLTENFGWRRHVLPYNPIDEPEQLIAAVDGWIEDLGGWAVAVPNAVTEADKQAHRMMIRYACAARDVTATDTVSMPRFDDSLADYPEWFGASIPQQVYVQTPGDWWRASDDWVTIAATADRPKRLAFMCYRYRELITVNASVLDLIHSGALADRYALMSHLEFFAEFYATWNRRGRGENNPRYRLRSAVPQFGTLLAQLDYHPKFFATEGN